MKFAHILDPPKNIPHKYAEGIVVMSTTADPRIETTREEFHSLDYSIHPEKFYIYLGKIIGPAGDFAARHIPCVREHICIYDK